MRKLTDLPNIGAKLAYNLERIGVGTPEQLQELGAEEAFLRIRAQVDPTACLRQLEALAGAVGPYWRQSAKRNLKVWYREL